jgi:hypothetical protein
MELHKHPKAFLQKVLGPQMHYFQKQRHERFSKAVLQTLFLQNFLDH